MLLKRKLFWGCTKPSLGMFPYLADPLSKQLVFNPKNHHAQSLETGANKPRKDVLII